MPPVVTLGTLLPGGSQTQPALCVLTGAAGLAGWSHWKEKDLRMLSAQTWNHTRLLLSFH